MPGSLPALLRYSHRERCVTYGYCATARGDPHRPPRPGLAARDPTGPGTRAHAARLEPEVVAAQHKHSGCV
jgi:hypothetical protein